MFWECALKTPQHGVYLRSEQVQKQSDTLVFLNCAFQHAQARLAMLSAKFCLFVESGDALKGTDQSQGTHPNLLFPALATGKYGCRKVRVYPTECGQQLGRSPSKLGSSKSLVFEEFFLGEGTLGLFPASLPHTLGYTCTFTPPLPLS